MTKITMTLDMDIPDDWDNGDISEELFHNIVNCAIGAHHKHIMDWMVSNFSEEGKAIAITDHKFWAERLQAAKWTFKRI